jgi:hypothetical protein
MVAGYQDDLDSEDDVVARAPVTVTTVDLSSDEEEDKAAAAPEIQITQDEDYEFEKIDLPKADNKASKVEQKSPKKPEQKLPQKMENEPKKFAPEKNKLENGHKESAKQTVVAKDMAKAKESDKKDTKKVATVITADTDSDSSDEDGGIQVLQDKEDISEDELNGGTTPKVQQQDKKVRCLCR